MRNSGSRTQTNMLMPSADLHHDKADIPQVKNTEALEASRSSDKPNPCGFRKICSTGQPSPCPIPGVGSGILEMRVKEGSKIRNLLGFAMARLQGLDHQTAKSQVLFTGMGRALTKTITCAEIMKRKVPGLHQVSKLQYKTVTEVWESQNSAQVQMTIHRTVPSICILLSKEPLDSEEPGYQPPDVMGSEDVKPANGPEGAVKPEKRPLSSFSHVALPRIKRAAQEQGQCSNSGTRGIC